MNKPIWIIWVILNWWSKFSSFFIWNSTYNFELTSTINYNTNSIYCVCIWRCNFYIITIFNCIISLIWIDIFWQISNFTWNYNFFTGLNIMIYSQSQSIIIWCWCKTSNRKFFIRRICSFWCYGYIIYHIISHKDISTYSTCIW